MSLSYEFIEKPPVPLCPYCENPMHERHSKVWGGRSWQYLAVEFQCSANDQSGPQHIMIRARTEAEWEQHAKKLKFEPPSSDKQN